MKSFGNNRGGQSMVEAVFSIGIMLLVVAAVLALTVSNIGGGQASELQVVANNLAREGIEVVRSVRDSNWLSGQPWNQGLSGQQARAEFTATSNDWKLNFNYSNDDLYLSPDGLYSHEATGNQKSIYSRQLDFEYVCLGGGGNEHLAFPCLVSEQHIGLKVTSRVSWQERGRQRAVTLEDLLYAWK